MRKKQWKARAKKAERELRDQKAVNAALQESVKRLKKRNVKKKRDCKVLLAEYHELLGKYTQLEREYEELVSE